MILAWTTDIHLTHARDDAALAAFLDGIRATKAEALVVTGDIGEANTFPTYVRWLRQHLGIPVLFVLGNHDFYGASIEQTLRAAASLHDPAAGIVWLRAGGVYELSPKVAVVGHEGWADGRYADWFQSQVDLNDYYEIPELVRGVPIGTRVNGRLMTMLVPTPKWATVLKRMRAMADDAGAHARTHLDAALQKYETVVFASHYPPFAQNAVYRGKVSDANWMPHFSCKALGDALLDMADAHPTRTILGLCGHSHGSADVRPRDNLRVLTGEARYCYPSIAGAFDL